MRNDTFVREKPAKLLIGLKNAEQTNTPNTIMGLSKASGMSFVHASNLLAELEEDGLITSSKVGRNKRITLTPKGQEVASAMENLLAKLHAPVPSAPAAETKAAQPAASSSQPQQEKATQVQEFPQPTSQPKKELLEKTEKETAE